MTDLDDLLAEVALRTDSTHHWTGKHQLSISDPDLAKELAAAVRALRDRPCPHIVTGEEGTSHCALAESANTAWAVRWQEQYDRAERAEAALEEARLSDIAARNPGIDMDEVRRFRAHDRHGGTDNPTSDERCGFIGRFGMQCSLRSKHYGAHLTVPAHLRAPAPTGGEDGR